jgi:hypothetical protein
VDPAVAAGLAVVLSALVSLAGVIYTQRATRRAAEDTAALEMRKVDASAYQAARTTWADHVESLRGQVAELRARVLELETAEQRCEQRNIELTRYSRTLIRVLVANGIEHPAPPAGG